MLKINFLKIKLVNWFLTLRFEICWKAWKFVNFVKEKYRELFSKLKVPSIDSLKNANDVWKAWFRKM